MAAAPGDFIWYDLLSDDLDATAAFYRAVVGWEVRSVADAALDQRLLSHGGVDVGAIVARPAEAEGVTARWMGYVAVADADAAVADIADAGGQVLVAPMDIPGTGRFALVADPEGARLDLLRPDGRRDAPAFRADGVGRVVWHELYARDPAAALDFYSGRFGWTPAEVFDMGPLGSYRTFALAGGDPAGGIMRDPAGGEPRWQFYFGVVGIAAARARVEAAGGRVRHGPVQVPGGAWILLAEDPHGVSFGLCAAADAP